MGRAQAMARASGAPWNWRRLACRELTTPASAFRRYPVAAPTSHAITAINVYSVSRRLAASRGAEPLAPESPDRLAGAGRPARHECARLNKWPVVSRQLGSELVLSVLTPGLSGSFSRSFALPAGGREPLCPRPTAG